MKFICIAKTGDLKIGRTYTGKRVGGKIQINDDLHDFDKFEFAPIPKDTLQGIIVKHVCEIEREVKNVPKTSDEIKRERSPDARVLEPSRTKAILWKYWRILMSKLFK